MSTCSDNPIPPIKIRHYISHYVRFYIAAAISRIIIVTREGVNRVLLRLLKNRKSWLSWSGSRSFMEKRGENSPCRESGPVIIRIIGPWPRTPATVHK